MKKEVLIGAFFISVIPLFAMEYDPINLEEQQQQSSISLELGKRDHEEESFVQDKKRKTFKTIAAQLIAEANPKEVQIIKPSSPFSTWVLLYRSNVICCSPDEIGL